MQSAKLVSVILRSVGEHQTLAPILVKRCTTLWGKSWRITVEGIFVGGVLKVPRSAYAAFISGMPYEEAQPKAASRKADPEEREAPLDSEVSRSESLRCKICGKRMPSESALRGHLKRHED